jgi:hypothetical protein
MTAAKRKRTPARRKSRVANVYISDKLHGDATRRAEWLGLTFSSFVAFALRRALADGPQSPEEILAPRSLTRDPLVDAAVLAVTKED